MFGDVSSVKTFQSYDETFRQLKPVDFYVGGVEVDNTVNFMVFRFLPCGKSDYHNESCNGVDHRTRDKVFMEIVYNNTFSFLLGFSLQDLDFRLLSYYCTLFYTVY